MSAPGPYRAHPYSIKDGSRVRFEIVAKDFDGEEYVVARTADDGSRVGEATANLLAAAPELYAAMWSLLNCHTGAPWQTEQVRNAAFLRCSAALAKAEGREA